MAIYMEYDGIKGNVTAAGYEGMIALDFVTFRVQRTISMTTGALANREVSTPTFSFLETGKRMDSASVGIFREAVAGSAGKQVKIHFVRTGKNQLQEFLTYTLQHCLPTFYRTVDTHRETSPAAERLYLSFTAVEVTHIASGSDNNALNPARGGYDLVAAKSL